MHDEQQHPKSLEQLREEQDKISRQFDHSQLKVTEVGEQYMKQLFGDKDLEAVLKKATRLVHRPQKEIVQKISFEKAAMIVTHIAGIKSKQQNRDFEVDVYNEAILDNMIKYFIGDPSCQWDLSKGLLLYGNVGLGKTYLITVMRHFVDAADIDFRKFKIYRCADIVEQVEDKGATAMGKYVEKDKDVCFDDLGQEQTIVKHYGNPLSVMERILDKRYVNFINGKCVTHLTTNLVPREIEPKYGTRIADRFNEMFNTILVKGVSRRR